MVACVSCLAWKAPSADGGDSTDSSSVGYSACGTVMWLPPPPLWDLFQVYHPEVLGTRRSTAISYCQLSIYKFPSNSEIFFSHTSHVICPYPFLCIPSATFIHTVFLCLAFVNIGFHAVCIIPTGATPSGESILLILALKHSTVVDME